MEMHMQLNVTNMQWIYDPNSSVNKWKRHENENQYQE